MGAEEPPCHHAVRCSLAIVVGPVSKWSDAILDGFAAHIQWEVRTLVEQSAWFASKYDCKIPAGFENALEDAALEGILLRLRRFNEFLGRSSGGRHDTDVTARDWVRNWNAEVWLDPRIRARIDWQVAHISSFREWEIDWQLCNHVLACCDELVRFFGEIADDERLAAFKDAPELARSHAEKLRLQLSS